MMSKLSFEVSELGETYRTLLHHYNWFKDQMSLKLNTKNEEVSEYRIIIKTLE